MTTLPTPTLGRPILLTSTHAAISCRIPKPETHLAAAAAAAGARSALPSPASLLYCSSLRSSQIMKKSTTMFDFFKRQYSNSSKVNVGLPFTAVAGTVAVAAGEAALSSFFDKLLDNLSSSDLLKTFQKENFDADLRKWKRMLQKIQAVLDDAEEKQVTNRSVKIWLDELEDLAYDVDNILDEFATEALRRELYPEPENKLQKLIYGYFGSNRDFVKQMRSKIEGIDRRLQEIVEEGKVLELRENSGGRTITKTSRPPSTSLVNEGCTYGRDEDKEEIVKLLLESSDAQLSVIPIVGMGGLGKTTLAQLVYKDDEVSRHFELKAWVCVSEDFDNLRLTREILRSFTSKSCDDNNDLDSLQRKLKDTLSGKKFLLILDDVWNENYDLWTELRKPFEFGAQGSKIVVTTRNDGVSSMMGINSPYKLKELSRDACLRVFTHHALDATDFSKYPELEEFGQKIVDRCKGAPLAAKALGGLLRTKHDPCHWEDVFNSKIWDIPEDKSSIFPVLKLSYSYLPSHLKRCFVYCSLFPKDHQFEMENLVLLWMAEGLVQETKGKKPMEDLGGDYFRDLLDRSFFQQSSFGESFFVMHDLMNDLAVWAAGDLCCRLEDQLGGSKQSKISTKVRHFSYIEHSNDCIQRFDDFPEDVHLRTFLSLPLYKPYDSTNFDVKYCFLPQLRCLRVLSLSGNYIFELPSSIGDLKHLRYLSLFYTKITILPESTSSLYNLQTLILVGCECLTKLPEKIENLVNLRHLEIRYANSIREMPVGIAKLKSLRTLCFDGMAKWQDWIPCRVECEEFPYLHELSISRCPSLKCVSTIVDLAAMLRRLDIEECPNLTSLSSRDTLPTTLKFLRLADCPKLESIVDKLNKDTLLEHLSIMSCEKLRCLPRGLHELCHLKKIDIESCNNLISLGDLLPTNLISLEINYCEKLEALPNDMHNLNFLQDLVIRDCPSIVSFPEKGFPTNLRKLTFRGANLCKQVFELGLHRLTSLTSLEIANGIMDSFPEEEDGKTMLMLPTSLTTLTFFDFPNLEFLSWKFFQNASALEQISIICCDKLASLSEKCFPPSLQRLKISFCPVLKQNCEKDKGIMWSKIANIPSVTIDDVEQQK